MTGASRHRAEVKMGEPTPTHASYRAAVMSNTIIYLIGFPGTGKHTIAKELASLGPTRLVDNHLINDPLFSIIQADGITRLPERIWDNVDKVWDAVLDTMVHISPPDYSFVLTNALFDHDPGDHRQFNKVRSAAEQRHAHFVPVVLTISDLDEHQRRIMAEGRRERSKETNPDSPRRYAAESKILRFEHTNKLVLDVSSLSPAEAAQAILEHTNQRGP